MKSRIRVITAILFAIIISFQATTGILAAGAATRDAVQVYTDFYIDGSGLATVTLNYTGYAGITTGATITTTISKKVLFFFWDEQVSWVDTPTGDYFYEEHDYQLSSGTYKCDVEYDIYGTGVPDDLVIFTDTKSY